MEDKDRTSLMDTEVQIVCPCLCAGRVKRLEETLQETMSTVDKLNMTVNTLESKLEHARLYGFSITAEDE